MNALYWWLTLALLLFCIGAFGALVRRNVVLDALEAGHPGFRDRLLDENGKLRRFVNVFVSDDDVRFLNGLDTPVPAGETVAIVPAVAGGC